MIDAKTKRLLYTIIVAVLSLSFIPGINSYILSFMQWEIVGTITPGMILGIIGLYIAYLLHPRQRLL